MSITQTLTVRNPPNVVDPEHATGEAGYTMWGTLPLPRGTDPRTFGNSFMEEDGQLGWQQYRKLAQTRNWDIYEWFVWNPGTLGRTVDTNRNETVDTVRISDSFKRPPDGRKRNDRIRRSDPSLPPGRPVGDINSGGELVPLFDAMVSGLDYLGGVRLEITGLANNDTTDVTETVYLTGNLNNLIRSGDCCVTKGKHVNTVNFGGFHIFWTVMRGRMDYQLVVQWHNGIPRSDVLVQKIKCVIKGTHEDVGAETAFPPPIIHRAPGQFTGAWNTWSEWTDPAIGFEFLPDRFNFYWLKPHPEGKYWPMPRMARRSWRFSFSPNRVGANFGVKPQVYPGWGVGLWSNGGFLCDNGKVWPTMFSHITEGTRWSAPDVVVGGVALLDGDLAVMRNSEQTENENGVIVQAQVSPNQLHLPAVGQQYGGPTGADDKYKPYAGIKALGANERVGLVEHSMLMMRHYARDYTAMYEPDGSVVDPLAHTRRTGISPDFTYLAEWDCYVGNGFTFVKNNNQDGIYGTWKDSGFGWSSSNNRRIRTKGTAGTLRDRIVAQWSMNGSTSKERLQSYANSDSAAFPTGQGWDSWDTQHRGIGWGHAGALYWLAGDPLARLVILGEAELANMIYWHGDGVAGGRFREATIPGDTVQYGRDLGWSIAAIARGVLVEGFQAEDSNDTTNASSQRGTRWMTGPIRRFIVSTQMAQTPAGIGWHTAPESTSKSFETPPFNSQYFVHQLFEMDYITHGLIWAADAAPHDEFFRSTRYPGSPVTGHGLLRDYARGVNDLWWTEACTPTAMAVLSGGSGYTNGDIGYLAHDRALWGVVSPGPTEDAKLTLTAPAGVVTAVAITVPGVYANQPYEGSDLRGTGCVVYAKTKGLNAFDGITITNGGSGFRQGETYTVGGGRPLGNNPGRYALIIRVEQVNAAGAMTAAKVIREGAYEEPPINPTLIGGSGQFGSGAVFTVWLSCSGVGLRVNPTWSAPFKSHYAGACWKIAPLRKYPGGASWATRSEWTGSGDYPPRDICLQPGMRQIPGSNPQVGGSGQELNAPSHQTALAHILWAGSPRGVTMLCEYFGVAASPPNLNAIRTTLRNRRFGPTRAAVGHNIEFWWPLYSALGQGT